MNRTDILDAVYDACVEVLSVDRATLTEGTTFVADLDADSLALVDGTEIDFGKQGLSEAFLFRNPNATAECGCGESFTTQADLA